jgi:plastocyanin
MRVRVWWGAIVLCLSCSSPSSDTVDGCGASDFVPATQIDWTFQVSPRCVEIKAGQSVTWNGNFATHPLEADQGDKPNPIASANLAGSSATVTFPAAGTFGFKCQVHSSMIGAVLVTP